MKTLFEFLLTKRVDGSAKLAAQKAVSFLAGLFATATKKTNNDSRVSEIHETALAAWIDLQKRGGLELHGRDEGLEEDLRNRLAPSAGSLEDALQTATPDDLVRAFYDTIQPYADMFRAILVFYEKAGATEGRAQWEIMVNEVDIRLDHFRRFLTKWNSVPCELEVPAVDSRGAWAIVKAMSGDYEIEHAHQADLALIKAGGVWSPKLEGEPYRSGAADIDNWLSAYGAPGAKYEEWPNSLIPSLLGPGFSDVAALALARLVVVREDHGSREELIEKHRNRGYVADLSDPLNIGTIAADELDDWFGTLVARLARSQSLPPEAKLAMSERLQEELARYPRRKFGARVEFGDLQSYLSLPIWQQRNELYAVWIATEIVNALSNHTCEIHHDNGKIVFASRETHLATVTSVRPPVRLISERRAPLSNPIGEGRVANVKPDYGLWRDEDGIETCGLVIEVKHYKKSDGRFGHVLTDYSRAFPKAQVYLVSHGPIGNVTSEVPAELLTRCHTIKRLTASHVSARDELRDAIREYVGKPDAEKDTVLAVDVSPSMSSYFGKPDFSNIVDLVIDDRCSSVALIDVAVRSVVPVYKLSEAIASTQGNGTSLGEPVVELLGKFERVLVITDDDGLNSLRQISNQTVIVKRSGVVAIEVVNE